MRKIQRILVANRGEIAVRIIRACRDLGIESVAIYSDVDRDALHVRYANRAYRIGEAPASDSYLRTERILEVAERSGADAVHPGYGFLSENAEFAAECRDQGITFIGPTPETMRLVGDKTEARAAALRVGVLTVPGSPQPIETAAEAAQWGEQLGYPVMLKAAAGGGGKGMRRVEEPAELESALRAATSEATSAFGDGRVYVEKVILNPRHVEIQILADEHGNRIHLGERECSLQRRHQKVLEESPSPVVSPELRKHMCDAALAVAESAAYTNAGTVEFLLDADRNFYFIEMNARLQVEHPVTEMLTGIDLVAGQIMMARGAQLGLRQEDVQLRGHAMECRIYAEDPAMGFAPSPGVVESMRTPGGPGVRNDSCLYRGCTVPIDYDPLVSKLITWGSDRACAIWRMQRALREHKVSGIATTAPLFRRILADPAFREGNFHTGYLDELLGTERLSSATRTAVSREQEADDVAAMAAAIHVYLAEESRTLKVRRSHTSAWKRAGREDSLRG